MSGNAVPAAGGCQARDARMTAGVSKGGSMRLGEILVARSLLSVGDINAALRRQLTEGGRLGENLIALGLLEPEQLASVIHSTPAIPNSLAETGIVQRNLLNLMLKFMYLECVETISDIADRIKLPHRLVQLLILDASQQRFVQSLGSTPGDNAFSIRYSLSELGRSAAKDALNQTLYVGPAPVPLSAYQEQIQKQRIANEMLDAAALRQGFEGLVVSDYYLRKLLPAINAGRSVLLFGPSGNGKTTLATRISTVFRDVIYVPYAVDVGGQIIRIFDPAIHKPSVSEADAAMLSAAAGLQREQFDERWVACKRPVIVAGGELTMNMLDLQHNPDTHFYDAPLHVKALNGMLLIDDFGRQKFEPDQLLNRWIVPMENQIDYFSLLSGATFSLPIDQLLIFSTNLRPSDLMDPAFLRRIPYKIKLFAPSREEYRLIFDNVCQVYGLTMTDEIFDFIIEELAVCGLAYYQPKFICEQVTEYCKSFNQTPELTKELAAEAISNLYFDIADSPDAEKAQARGMGHAKYVMPSAA
jgi:energy-coupling factor transporter ATP-binding protein EcfA2